MRAWYAPTAAEELLHFRSLVEQVGSADVLRVVLARSARSARRTAHFDLDFPRAPQLEPYWCHKHRRECRPVEAARRFLLRYTLDTLDRIEAFAAVRAEGRIARMLHGDARDDRPRGAVRRRHHVAAVSRPDRLPRAASVRLRAARPRRATRSRARPARPRDRPRRDRGVRRTESPRCSRTRGRRSPSAAACASSSTTAATSIRRSCKRAGLRLVDRHERHVNRRTGRRAGEYYESILVAVAR